jgi:hypothetical protein
MSEQKYCPACTHPHFRQPSAAFRFCSNCRVQLYTEIELSSSVISSRTTTGLPVITANTFSQPQESFALLKASGAIDVVYAARKSGKKRGILPIRNPIPLISQGPPEPVRFVRRIQLINGPAGQLNINLHKFKPIPGTDLLYHTDAVLDQEIDLDEFFWTQMLWRMLIENNLTIWKEFTRHQWRMFGQGLSFNLLIFNFTFR